MRNSDAFFLSPFVSSLYPLCGLSYLAHSSLSFAVLACFFLFCSTTLVGAAGDLGQFPPTHSMHRQAHGIFDTLALAQESVKGFSFLDLIWNRNLDRYTGMG